MKSQLYALEEQSSAAEEHLREAQSQVTDAMSKVSELQRTVGFMKEVFQVLGQEYDGQEFSRTLVTWFCEHFGVERCSLMIHDETRAMLQIGAYRGIDAAVAGGVRVRVGQGIAGWVALHRKPLLMRVKSEEAPVQHTRKDAYNSDSFISVPMVSQQPPLRRAESQQQARRGRVRRPGSRPRDTGRLRACDDPRQPRSAASRRRLASRAAA